MPKKLTVNTALCDLRHVQEATLDAYERIRINTAVLITNARARALLAGRAVALNTACTVDLEDETVETRVVNGQFTLRGGDCPALPQYLIVNGTMTVEADAGPALARYVGVLVNGSLCGPQGLLERLPNLQVNGSTEAWPDGATPLEPTAELDPLFALRARADRYWAARRLVLLDPRLAESCASLLQRGVRLSAPQAVMAESLAPRLAPLLDTDCRLTVVPDGTVLLRGDHELDAALLRRHGTKLYLLGDLRLTPASAPLLPQLDFLSVVGTVTLPRRLAEAFAAVDGDCGALVTVRDRVIAGAGRTVVTRALLAEEGDGLTCLECGRVEIAADVPPALIRDRLQLLQCGPVYCSAAQRDAVQLVSTDGDRILTGEAEQAPPRDPDAVRINATSYTL